MDQKCHYILSKVNKFGLKLTLNEKQIIKDLGKKIRIKDEDLFKYINQDNSMEDFKINIKFIYI